MYEFPPIGSLPGDDKLFSRLSTIERGQNPASKRSKRAQILRRLYDKEWKKHTGMFRRKPQNDSV